MVLPNENNLGGRYFQTRPRFCFSFVRTIDLHVQLTFDVSVSILSNMSKDRAVNDFFSVISMLYRQL